MRLTLLLFLASSCFGATWYVRPDGGTRVQCTGLTDAAYPGSGTGQACAFIHPYYLWTDDASTGSAVSIASISQSGNVITINTSTSLPGSVVVGSGLMIMGVSNTSLNSAGSNKDPILNTLPNTVLSVVSGTQVTVAAHTSQTASSSGGTVTQQASWGWIIAGGDIVLIKNNANGSKAQYRMGSARTFGGTVWRNCISVSQFCTNPDPPSGTDASHATIIAGEHYMTLAAGVTELPALNGEPQLYGGDDLIWVLSLHGAANIIVAGLDITDHAQCAYGDYSKGGDWSNGNHICVGGGDYARRGFYTANTTNAIIQDTAVHGMSHEPLLGGAQIGMQLIRSTFVGNGNQGVDLDDFSDQTGYYGCPINTSTDNGHLCSYNDGLTISYVTVAYNGCIESYPIVGSPVYDNCHHPGTGDGISEALSGGNWIIDHLTLKFNTEDGADLLYVGKCKTIGTNSTACTTYGTNDPAHPDQYNPSSLTITDSFFQGSLGNQVKVGSQNSIVMRNNIVIGSCKSSWDGSANPDPANLGPNWNSGTTFAADYCRGGGGAVVLEAKYGATMAVQNNSITGEAEKLLRLQCGPDDGTDLACGSSVQIHLDNNLIVGWPRWNRLDWLTAFVNDGSSKELFTTTTGSTRRNNLRYHTKIDGPEPCPDIGANTSGEQCVDPLLVGQSSVNAINFRLSPTSPALAAGIAISGITTDFQGGARPNPPAIGAYEIYAGPVAPTITSTSPLPGATIGDAYTFSFAATGTATIAWSATGVPAGLTLDSDGTLHGTPSGLGSSTIHVTAANGTAPNASADFGLTIGASPKTATNAPFSGTIR